jgi:hypothetical protein
MSNGNDSNIEYNGEWPTDEYPNARPTPAFPEPYAYGFRRSLAANAAEAERREGKLFVIVFTTISEIASTAARRAAVPPSSLTPDVAPSCYDPQLPTWPPVADGSKPSPSCPFVAIKLTHHLTDTPPQVQPGTPQGFTNRNEYHAEYLRSHQANMYDIAAPQNPQSGSAQGYGNGKIRASEVLENIWLTHILQLMLAKPTLEATVRAPAPVVLGTPIPSHRTPTLSLHTPDPPR